MTANEFIQAVRDEKLGFKFDQPWRLGEDSNADLYAVLPILRTTRQKRTYLTFAEAQDVEARDTGSIDKIYVKNHEDLPIYISRGDIFKGKTQERAAIHGYIIMPGKGASVDVRCINRSKGIQQDAETTYGGRTPYGVDLSNQARTWDSIHSHNTAYYSNSSKVPDFSYHDTSQTNSLFTEGSVTNTAALNLQSDPSIESSTIPLFSDFHQSDSLVNALGNMRSALHEAMTKIPNVRNQVGVAFFEATSILGLEVYDIPKSWKSLQDDIIAKEGSNFLNEDDNLFEVRLKPDRAVGLLQRKLAEPFTEKVIYSGKYKVIGIKNSLFIGEAVEFKGRVIHLSLWKNQSN